MPKPRDYKAEYQRRISRGLARGLSRSQAAGHPKGGELPASSMKFGNPFQWAKDTISNILSKIEDAIKPLPKSTTISPSTETEYIEQYDKSGITVLPRWSTGDQEHEPNLSDIRVLWTSAVANRYQRDYTIVICGSTEEDYPDHDKNDTCLSYRVNRAAVERLLTSPKSRDTAEFVNSMLSKQREENWLTVYRFQILDKE